MSKDRAHAQPLGLEQLALSLKFGKTLAEFDLDRFDRALHGVRSDRVVRRREQAHGIHGLDHIARERVQRVEGLDLVAEHLDADRELFVDRDDLDRVAAHPELAAREVVVVALVLHIDEVADEPLAIDALPDLQGNRRREVLVGSAEAVDAGDGRHDDDISATEQRVGRGVTEALDLGVDRRVLLDEGVGLWHVRLRLVVVVVRHEVLDGVVGHELAELVRELRGQRLVVREHEGRPLHLLDEPRRRCGLARARCPEQHDIGLAGVDALREFFDGLRLVAARLVLADDLERSDGARGFHS